MCPYFVNCYRIQKELLAQLLLSQDHTYNRHHSDDVMLLHLHSHPPDPVNPTHSSSTCTANLDHTPPGRAEVVLEMEEGGDVLVGGDTGVPVQESEVKDVVRSELVKLIQTLASKEGRLDHSYRSRCVCECVCVCMM